MTPTSDANAPSDGGMTDAGDVVGDAATGFDPTTLGSCQMWLRADRGVEIDDAGSVKAWRDQSGRGRDALGVDGASPPRLEGAVAALNLEPAVLFESANPNAASGAVLKTAAWMPPPTPPLTYYAVFRQRTPSAQAAVVFASENRFSGTLQGQSILIAQSNTSNPALVGTASGFSASFAMQKHDEATVATLVAASAGDKFFVNSLSAVPPNPAVDADAAAVPNRLAIGAADTGAFNLQGYVAEFIVYSEAHNDPERTKVMTALAARYGIHLKP